MEDNETGGREERIGNLEAGEKVRRWEEGRRTGGLVKGVWMKF